MNPIKTSKNDFLTPLTKKNLLNRKLLAEKLLLSQNNLSNINPNYSENYLFFNEKLSNINLKKDESEYPITYKILPPWLLKSNRMSLA